MTSRVSGARTPIALSPMAREGRCKIDRAYWIRCSVGRRGDESSDISCAEGRPACSMTLLSLDFAIWNPLLIRPLRRRARPERC